MKLERYDAARRALAEAVRIDEVKALHDKAMAMRVYAQQAKDVTLIAKATELRMRAERRAGELLREMEKNKGARGNPHGRGAKIVRSQETTAHPKLSDLGVSKTQSSRWQKLAELDDNSFEQRVDLATEKAIETIARPVEAKPKKKTSAKSKPNRREEDKSRPFDPVTNCLFAIRETLDQATLSIPSLDQQLELLRLLRQSLDQLEKNIRASFVSEEANG